MNCACQWPLVRGTGIWLHLFASVFDTVAVEGRDLIIHGFLFIYLYFKILALNCSKMLRIMTFLNNILPASERINSGVPADTFQKWQHAASEMLFDLNSILLMNNKTLSVSGVACDVSGSHNLASVGICFASSSSWHFSLGVVGWQCCFSCILSCRWVALQVQAACAYLLQREGLLCEEVSSMLPCSVPPSELVWPILS